MFYRIIKFLARCSLLFFFRKKIVCGTSLRHLKGPAIIAANHPNSMMDAIVIACLCKQPVHFTIRSDMFQNPLFKFLLKFLNGIPVYRQSEAKERVRDNFTTINHCREILKQNGIIIVFVEGVTLHDWKLKPLKSGTAKIVSHAIADDYLEKRLQVVPVGLTYSDYNHPAKTILVHTGEIFYPGLMQRDLSPGLWKQAFNAALFHHLQPLIACMQSTQQPAITLWKIVLNLSSPTNCAHAYKLHAHAAQLSAPSFQSPLKTPVIRHYLPENFSAFCKSIVLAALFMLPGLIGLILNGLYYFPISKWAYAKTKDSIFYDALLCGLITVTYPVYVLILAILSALAASIPFWVSLAVMPISGWCSMQVFVYILKVRNYTVLDKKEKDFIRDLVR